MDKFDGGVHVDYNEAGESSAGLFSNGASKISEDMIGNPAYRISFQLYTGLHAFQDYDQLKNSDFLLKPTYYLDSMSGQSITESVNGAEFPGEITRILRANVMIFDVPIGDINDGIRYQMQIAVTYGIYEFD